jgi:hypothetical protein
MSEYVLLIIAGILVLIAVVVIRAVIAKRQMQPFGKRIEVVIRFGLCIVAALICFAIYHSLSGMNWQAFINLLATSFLIYGVTHVFDRLIFGE